MNVLYIALFSVVYVVLPWERELPALDCGHQILTACQGLYSRTNCCKKPRVAMRMAKIGPPVAPKPLTDFNDARNISVCREYDHTCRSMRRYNNVDGRFRRTVMRLYRNRFILFSIKLSFFSFPKFSFVFTFAI